MASLYQIDEAILSCIDEETGEILDFEKLNALQMERDEKIEKMALWYKNLCSDAEAYKAEKMNFAEKQKAAENKAESVKNWLDNALSGNPFKSTKVDIKYRKSKQVIIDDLFKIDDSYLKYAEPTPDKAAIKKAIENGVKLKGCHIEEKQNINIK